MIGSKDTVANAGASSVMVNNFRCRFAHVTISMLQNGIKWPQKYDFFRLSFLLYYFIIKEYIIVF